MAQLQRCFRLNSPVERLFQGGRGHLHVLNREPYSATGQHSCHTAVENDACLGTPKLQAEPKLQHTQPSISNDVTSQKWFRQLIALMLNGVGQSTFLTKAMKYLLIVNLKEYICTFCASRLFFCDATLLHEFYH